MKTVISSLKALWGLSISRPNKTWWWSEKQRRRPTCSDLMKSHWWASSRAFHFRKVITAMRWTIPFPIFKRDKTNTINRTTKPDFHNDTFCACVRVFWLLTKTIICLFQWLESMINSMMLKNRQQREKKNSAADLESMSLFEFCFTFCRSRKNFFWLFSAWVT